LLDAVHDRIRDTLQAMPANSLSGDNDNPNMMAPRLTA
jgi:hypothetical protein